MAINEKSEKFWYGVNDKVWVNDKVLEEVWGLCGSVGSECGKVSGECREGVWGKVSGLWGSVIECGEV